MPQAAPSHSRTPRDVVSDVLTRAHLNQRLPLGDGCYLLVAPDIFGRDGVTVVFGYLDPEAAQEGVEAAIMLHIAVKSTAPQELAMNLASWLEKQARGEGPLRKREIFTRLAAAFHAASPRVPETIRRAAAAVRSTETG